MKPAPARALILATTLVVAEGARAASPVPLRMDGLGPLKFGMTPHQVAKAIGPLDISYDAGGPECGEGRAKEPWIPGVSLMFVKGRLARIDVYGPATKTEAGVGVASTEEQVKRAYGKRLTVEPRPYDDDDQDLVVNDAKHRRKLIFETYKGRIDTFRSGVTGPVDYIEGCA